MFIHGRNALDASAHYARRDRIHNPFFGGDHSCARLDIHPAKPHTRPMSLLTDDIRSTLHDTKRRLLEASLELMLERGYSGLSVDDVLHRADISKGSFYHHFQNKQDMALQAIDLYTNLGHQ